MSVATGLPSHAAQLFRAYGPKKSMPAAPSAPDQPLYFLLRRFGTELDLLVILNTQRCRYQCSFCQLPAGSSRVPVADTNIAKQFGRVLHEVRHALGVVDRITLSNNGSVLDAARFGDGALNEIVLAIGELRRVRRVEVETRLEFVKSARLARLARCSGAQLGVLTGFETFNETIRTDVLGKRESLDSFISGLNRVAAAKGTALTAYVLFKPAPSMTDAEALYEARQSINFLRTQCGSREIPLTIRLNPMYLARNSDWARQAARAAYVPPRLTDVLKVAQEAADAGTPTYIGLSTEDRADSSGTYRVRRDFSPLLLSKAIQFNNLNASVVTTVATPRPTQPGTGWLP